MTDKLYNTSFDELALALANDYVSIYVIDMSDDSYVEYTASGANKELKVVSQGDNFYEDTVINCRKLVYSKDQERFLNTFKKEHLLDAVQNGRSFSLRYRLIVDGEPQYYFLKTIKGNDEKIIIGVQNIDEQTRRNMAEQAKTKTYSDIAMALSNRYEVIYYVNIVTNEYMEYSSSAEYAKLEVGTKGKDFFAAAQENMKKDIYPEDYPMMKKVMEKDYLMGTLDEDGKNVISYRLMLGGRPQYVTLFVVRPKEDSDHIIVAVANIDSAKRMEMNYEEAMDKANHDELTGVKNKRSYAHFEMKMDERIEKREIREFAVVVLDINGLKQVNDTMGHSAGDMFIKDACEMISSIFKNSHIYRIGGDEFAAVLEGPDFEDREQLIEELNRVQEENKEQNKVTVAFGISDYVFGEDMRLQDVFERADNQMYENKKEYKNLIVFRSSKEEAGIPISDEEEHQRFSILFSELMDAITDMEKLDFPIIKKKMCMILELFRLSNGVARLYKNVQEEKQGGGETLSCYEIKDEDTELFSIRMVTSVMSIGTITVYQSPDAIPLSEEEHRMVELAMRTTLSYLTRKRLAEMVSELTYRDDIGYLNLRSYMKYITSEENRKNFGGCAAFRYNLRHFSVINKEIGRLPADQVMLNHFETLQKMIGDSGILCRLGGDNFIGICSGDKLGNVLTYLNEATVVYDSASGKCVNVSASAGIFRIPVGYTVNNPGDIMEKVISAYNAAQSGGKEHIVFYNESLVIDKDKSDMIQQMFPEALRNEEFKVFYQPKVNVKTGELVGAEALCRWIHDDDVISPNEFIPILEETNDICKLDFYMLERVCRDIRRWIDSGMKVVRVSVNLSRKHMVNQNLLDKILKIIDRRNIPHNYIEIELTETTTDVNFADLKRVVGGLQEVEVYTSVDDFGVGYSSLNLLRELPWNVVKVDRSFLPIDGEEYKETNDVMFNHVVSLAKDLGLECIVEGVETPHHMNILLSNNCDIAQGYLFDRPLPVEEFENRLEMGYYDIKEHLKQ